MLVTASMGLYLVLPNRGLAHDDEGIRPGVPNGTYVLTDSGFRIRCCQLLNRSFSAAISRHSSKKRTLFGRRPLMARSSRICQHPLPWNSGALRANLDNQTTVMFKIPAPSPSVGLSRFTVHWPLVVFAGCGL